PRLRARPLPARHGPGRRARGDRRVPAHRAHARVLGLRLPHALMEAIKEGLRGSLRDLLALHGAPGFEQAPVAYFEKRVQSLADNVDVDRYGNVTALRRGRHGHPPLMVSAHRAEI